METESLWQRTGSRVGGAGEVRSAVHLLGSFLELQFCEEQPRLLFLLFDPAGWFSTVQQWNSESQEKKILNKWPKKEREEPPRFTSAHRKHSAALRWPILLGPWLFQQEDQQSWLIRNERHSDAPVVWCSVGKKWVGNTNWLLELFLYFHFLYDADISALNISWFRNQSYISPQQMIHTSMTYFDVEKLHQVILLKQQE